MQFRYSALAVKALIRMSRKRSDLAHGVVCGITDNRNTPVLMTLDCGIKSITFQSISRLKP